MLQQHWRPPTTTAAHPPTPPQKKKKKNQRDWHKPTTTNQTNPHPKPTTGPNPHPPPEIHHQHKPTSTKSNKPTSQIHQINYKIQQTTSHPPNQTNPHPKPPPWPSLMEVFTSGHCVLHIGVPLHRKMGQWSMVSLGDLYLSTWQDRRWQVRSGERVWREWQTERARDVDEERARDAFDRRREKKRIK